MQCGAVHLSALPLSVVECCAIQFSLVQCRAVQCFGMVTSCWCITLSLVCRGLVSEGPARHGIMHHSPALLLYNVSCLLKMAKSQKWLTAKSSGPQKVADIQKWLPAKSNDFQKWLPAKKLLTVKIGCLTTMAASQKLLPLHFRTGQGYSTIHFCAVWCITLHVWELHYSLVHYNTV